MRRQRVVAWPRIIGDGVQSRGELRRFQFRFVSRRESPLPNDNILSLTKLPGVFNREANISGSIQPGISLVRTVCKDTLCCDQSESSSSALDDSRLRIVKASAESERGV